MTREEIYTAALKNCAFGEGANCRRCPYDGYDYGACIINLMTDIRNNDIEPEEFIAAGLII